VRAFVARVHATIAGASSPAEACEAIRPSFAELLADPDWLPAEYRAAAEESGMGGGIGQWLLYRAADGSRRSLGAGDFYVLMPPRDDIHRVRTTSAETSVSIHLLTNDTGCVWRHAYDASSGDRTPFRSGYVNVACGGQNTRGGRHEHAT